MDYNFVMFSLIAARTLSHQALAQALAALGDALPPGFLLALAQGVSEHTPRSMADRLIMRSTCRVRQLQAAVPQLSLPSGPGRLLEAISKSRRQHTRDELDLAQAILEFYIGLILRLLRSGNPRSLGHCASASPLFPRILALSFSSEAGEVCLKRPLSI